MSELFTALIGGVSSGSVISLIGGFFLQRKSAQIQNQVRTEFDRRSTVYFSRRKWKELALSELLGPMSMQLDRTERAFRRYSNTNIYLEAKVLRVGNETIRDLLLAKGHLIPFELIGDAGRLVEHYDRWLEEFERHRGNESPELGSRFIFAGPSGFPFPSDADHRFRTKCAELARELAEGVEL